VASGYTDNKTAKKSGTKISVDIRVKTL